MTPLEFSAVARRVGAACLANGLHVPAFRVPPRRRDLTRSVRFHPGGAVVSVRLADRDDEAVIDDVVLGALVANRKDATHPALSALAAAARGVPA